MQRLNARGSRVEVPLEKWHFVAPVGINGNRSLPFFSCNVIFFVRLQQDISLATYIFSQRTCQMLN